MLLGNKEKTIRLHAENFLQGNITFDYGTMEEERMGLTKASRDLSTKFLDWLHAEEKQDTSKEHKIDTTNLYRHIISWRVRGRIKGKIIDENLESTIEELVRDKSKLQETIKEKDSDILKALNTLKEQDRQIALMESQIFYLKQGRSGGT